MHLLTVLLCILRGQHPTTPNFIHRGTATGHNVVISALDEFQDNEFMTFSFPSTSGDALDVSHLNRIRCFICHFASIVLFILHICTCRIHTRMRLATIHLLSQVCLSLYHYLISQRCWWRRLHYMAAFIGRARTPSMCANVLFPSPSPLLIFFNPSCRTHPGCGRKCCAHFC